MNETVRISTILASVGLRAIRMSPQRERYGSRGLCRGAASDALGVPSGWHGLSELSVVHSDCADQIRRGRISRVGGPGQAWAELLDLECGSGARALRRIQQEFGTGSNLLRPPESIRSARIADAGSRQTKSTGAAPHGAAAAMNESSMQIQLLLLRGARSREIRCHGRREQPARAAISPGRPPPAASGKSHRVPGRQRSKRGARGT